MHRLVRENDNAPERVKKIIDTLVLDFVHSPNSNARNGGLIGLAASAIALGSPAVAAYLDVIVPPILSCFSDQDSRVRYYALESGYNVCKVAKGEILRFFNDVFDALCKLAVDPETSVKNGAELLDRLIKDIVCELSATYVSQYQPSQSPHNNEPAVYAPNASPSNKAFSLPRFIPLLKKRIGTMNSFTRQYLVAWIAVLDSIPELELLSYLSEFLDGLIQFLSDKSEDVRVATGVLLADFLQEIKQAGSQEEQKKVGSEDTGQGVVVQHARIIEILIPHLSSPEEEIQRIALQWLWEFIPIAKKIIIQFTPKLIAAILPCLAHSISAIRACATEVNQKLQKLVLEAHPSGPEPVASLSDPFTAALPTPHVRRTRYSDVGHTIITSDSNAPFDYQATVATLRLQFLNDHEETRVASLKWLLMLHRKVPNKILAADDGTFPVLLKTLSDPSEEVVRHDIQLLAQISSHSSPEFFRNFMIDLLSLFSTDRLLETRGSLIIRRLCMNLDPERIYCTIADILEKDKDLEFASVMVQNLNVILITSPELAGLRKRLRNVDNKDDQRLFITLYKSWCHNAVAAFSLCLLAQVYEHSANMLQVFADLEMTVSMLIQIDKLVQLLESPAFTYLRLQLLEPEKYPYLFKCLYGILLLLPQSSAFSTLRNRLSSVSSLGFLHVIPKGMSNLSLDSSRRQAASKAEGSSASKKEETIKFHELLQHFKAVQAEHERHRNQAIQTISRASVLKTRRPRYGHASTSNGSSTGSSSKESERVQIHSAFSLAKARARRELGD
ncbi:hypothetical protein EC973_003697 [Apophysomyces ossiformis]|uniref:Vacuolar protein 14 C-terminal Fig4-binding domain-containing protein n=1 Tax=Apophysomyces ossiformis TaxID=679940 RepID=A0A8H7BHR0_9FUNG|nr:hypothetical protein EC973_003697 [Apophysomyces ossiformis]